MTEQIPEPEAMLTSGEIATMFGVTVQTVYRWARSGAMESTRTPGGHFRFSAARARALLEGDSA